jgi:CMP-N-acetylneuraminic acid synthetase
VLERGLLVSDGDVRGYEMPEERSFDIDTPRDLALAELLVSRGELII